MDAQMQRDASRIFDTLVSGNDWEREEAVERLANGDPKIDHGHLRRRILCALTGQYSVELACRTQKNTNRARGWLLSSLGHVAHGDSEAYHYLRTCTETDREPCDRHRYWALYSLIVAAAPGVESLAEQIARDDDASMAAALARVFMAAKGNSESLLEVLRDIRNRELRYIWATSAVFLEEAVDALCDLVKSLDHSDATFYAIDALAKVPHSSLKLVTAVSAIKEYVERVPRNEEWESNIVRAVWALGRLASPSAVDLLRNELRGQSDRAAYWAAMSLGRIEGFRLAAEHVYEVLAATDSAGRPRYVRALRDMPTDDVLGVLISQEDRENMSPRHRDSTQCLKYEIEVTRQKEKHAKTILALAGKKAEQHRNQVDASLHGYQSGYKVGLTMNVTVFALGAGLILFAATLVGQGREVPGAVAGAGGMWLVFYNSFFVDPWKRSHMASHLLLRKTLVLDAYHDQMQHMREVYAHAMCNDRPVDDEKLDAYCARSQAILKETLAAIGNTHTSTEEKG